MNTDPVDDKPRDATPFVHNNKRDVAMYLYIYIYNWARVQGYTFVCTLPPMRVHPSAGLHEGHFQPPGLPKVGQGGFPKDTSDDSGPVFLQEVILVGNCPVGCPTASLRGTWNSEHHRQVSTKGCRVSSGSSAGIPMDPEAPLGPPK